MGSFDPKSFFDLAKDLTAKLGESETNFRTAIGRAYYAAFLSARTKIPASSWTGMKKLSDEHWFVRHMMKKMSHPEIADKLETLHQVRKTSDYDLSASVVKSDFENAIQLSENVLQLIEAV